MTSKHLIIAVMGMIILSMPAAGNSPSPVPSVQQYTPVKEVSVTHVSGPELCRYSLVLTSGKNVQALKNGIVRRLLGAGYNATIVKDDTRRDWWFVVGYTSDDIQQVEAFRNRFKSIKTQVMGNSGFSPWILEPTGYVAKNTPKTQATPQRSRSTYTPAATTYTPSTTTQRTTTLATTIPETAAQPKVEPSAAPAPAPQTVVQRAVSEIDRNIPRVATTEKSTFAVIIGNERYENEASVPYAENDARVFREYVQKTLGVPEKQIRYVANGGLNGIRMAVRWLAQAMDVCGGQGRAIFYYAGHGIPDEANKTAYLLPVDGMGSDVESGYALDRLYTELGKMPAQRVTVFLDACFSGAKREGGMMASARGVAIKVRSSAPQGNVVVFTAAQGDETAYPYREQQHGMFTYYLLKKLQSTKGNTTLGELGDYLTQEVKRQSFVENSKVQTPTVTPSEGMGQAWRTMKLK